MKLEVELLADNSYTLKNELGKWRGIHPYLTGWEGGITADYYSDLVSENSQKIIAAQAELSNNIIASIDFNAKEIATNISTSIEDLNSTIELGFTEVLWQLQQQQSSLKTILKTLQKPLETKAIELRDRGFNAYKHHWIDDALADLQQAAIDNKYDFTIHQALGNIYLFHKYNPIQALESYKKSAQYSEPYSKQFSAYALLHTGLVYYFIQDYSSAYESSKKAIQLFPDSSFCYYEHARYCAKLNKTDEAMDCLKKIVYQEPFYCAKINLEPDFSSMRNEIQVLFNDVFLQFKQIAEKRINQLKELENRGKHLGVESEQLKTYIRSIKKAEEHFSHQKILDLQDSIIEAETGIKGLLVTLESHLERIIDERTKFSQNLPDSIKNTSNKQLKIIMIIIGGFFIIERSVHHVLDGINQWGLGFGIVAGIIVGIIWGLLLTLSIGGIIYFCLLFFFWVKDRYQIKNKKNQTQKTLEWVKDKLNIIKEEKRKFTPTFYRSKLERRKKRKKRPSIPFVEGERYNPFDEEDDYMVDESDKYNPFDDEDDYDEDDD